MSQLSLGPSCQSNLSCRHGDEILGRDKTSNFGRASSDWAWRQGRHHTSFLFSSLSPWLFSLLVYRFICEATLVGIADSSWLLWISSQQASDLAEVFVFNLVIKSLRLKGCLHWSLYLVPGLDFCTSFCAPKTPFQCNKVSKLESALPRTGSTT